MIQTGTRVRWTSKSQGSEKTKEGIAYLVPKGFSPRSIMFAKTGLTETTAQIMFDGYPRSHDSFMVVVDRGHTRQKAIYWPRVSQLTAVGLDADAKSLVDLISELRRLQQKQRVGWVGKYEAVLIRKATIREIVKQLEAKS